ncbi:MAG TPA: hypothetical protein VN700_00900 [Vicinamibacterales bacterium]|nr:hypothetical protein [Vicinamibacterales bacterium]
MRRSRFLRLWVIVFGIAVAGLFAVKLASARVEAASATATAGTPVTGGSFDPKPAPAPQQLLAPSQAIGGTSGSQPRGSALDVVARFLIPQPAEARVEALGTGLRAVHRHSHTVPLRI